MAPGKPQPTTRRAHHRLREMIFSGALAPGSMHLEGDLATTLGMSRTPVREAALQLEAQGLVEVRPRKGLRILPVSPEDMAEVYDVLTALEALAAECAAAARHGPAQLGPLRGAINAMDARLAQGDLEGWAEADEAFHCALVTLGGNARIVAIAAMMTDQVRRARAVTLHLRPPPAQSNADHRAVLEAIAAGDATRAGAIHRAHRRAARDMLVGLLRKHRLPGL